MSFRTLRTFHYRNLADAEIELSAPEIFFVGENGQGKTNLLEAIYFLCFGASFRTRADSLLLRHGEREMSLQGAYVAGAERGEILAKIDGAAKEIRLNGKVVRDRKELLAASPCIVFSHDDLLFVSGSPEERRRFLNQTMSLHDPLFIDLLRRYHRLLKLRNAALRERRRDLVELYDGELAESGLSIQERRERASGEFNEIFRPLFRSISGLDGELDLRYAPSWRRGARPEEIRSLLGSRYETDCELGTTSSGPHRDRLHFSLAGRDFSKSASTGQLRLMSLILRICQASYFSKATGRKPLLLLDDVLLELDPVRRERFIGALPASDQVVYTFLPDERYAAFRSSSTIVYRVEKGAIIG